MNWLKQSSFQAFYRQQYVVVEPMNSVESIVKFVEELIVVTTGKPLSVIQKVILQETLTRSSKTYAQIAQETNYAETYIKQCVAPQLWSQLSKAFGEKVNRTSCYTMLEQRFAATQPQNQPMPFHPVEATILELPEGQVPLASALYIRREPIESSCYQEILQPGALLRITGPRKIGKTSLLARILVQGQTRNYHTVRLSLHQAETEIFSSTKKFLVWICANIAQQLGLESKLDHYWDDEIGTLTSCTVYLRSYILTEVSQPLILAFDSIDQIVDYPVLARDFFALLRSWYEMAKDVEIWKKLRLIIVHATDIYIPVKTSQSPFNVGLVTELTALNQTQLEDLVQRRGFQLTVSEFGKLISLTGGFPHLVQLCLYQSKRYGIPLISVLENATTKESIFNQTLEYLAFRLRQDSRLIEGLKGVLESPTELEAEVAFKLKSLGLVNMSMGKAYMSCGLYQNYFSNRF